MKTFLFGFARQIAILIALISFTISGFAAVRTSNTALGIWSNPTTWDCVCVPALTDDIVIRGTDEVILALPFTQIDDITINTGGKLSASGFLITVTGNIILNGELAGASLVTIGFPGSSTTLDGSGLFTSIATINILGDMDILASADIQMIGGDMNLADNLSGADPVVTNFGTIKLGPANLKAAGVDCMFDNRGTLNSGSDVFQANGLKGKLEASFAGNTVAYMEAGAQNVKAPESTYHHLYFETSGVKTLVANTNVDGDLRIDGSSQLNAAGFDISVAGDWTNISTNGDPFVEAGTEITFDGSAPQNLTCSAEETFHDLVINNTSATGLTLNDDTRVDNSLSLVDGNVFSSASSLLTISDDATSTNGSSSSFVDGPMRKEGNDIFTFPVGDGSEFARIGISAPASTAAIFEAEYHDGSYSNTSSLVAALNNVSTVEYWDLNRIATGNNVSITLYWENGTRSDINNMGDIEVGGWDGSQWQDRGQSTTSGTTAAGSVTSNGAISTFGPFTFGSSSGAVNPLGEGGGPLPIELIALNALKDPDGVRVNWVTATEIDNDFYSVERSADGLTFEEIAIVNGNGNTSSLSNYSYLDRQPYYGVSYYRLKQTDFDGSFAYTEVVTVRNDVITAANGVKIFPNPVLSGESFNIALPDGSSVEGEEVLIILADVVGREVFSKLVVYENNGAKLAVDVNDRLDPGVYMVLASNYDKIVFKERILIIDQQ